MSQMTYKGISILVTRLSRLSMIMETVGSIVTFLDISSIASESVAVHVSRIQAGR
jgi:hypothetical protein